MRVKAVALAALMTSLVSLAESVDKTVWRVGVFDGSSSEPAGSLMGPFTFWPGRTSRAQLGMLSPLLPGQGNRQIPRLHRAPSTSPSRAGRNGPIA